MIQKDRKLIREAFSLIYEQYIDDKSLAKELNIHSVTFKKYKTEKQIANKKKYHIKDIEDLFDTYMVKTKYSKAKYSQSILLNLLKIYNRLFITTQELANLINKSVATVEKKIKKKIDIPSYIKFNGTKATVRFCIIHVAEYMAFKKIHCNLPAYNEKFNISLDTMRFQVDGDITSKLITLFKPHYEGLNTIPGIDDFKRYEFYKPVPINIYYVKFHDITVVEFYGLKSYKEKDKLVQGMLSLFYNFLYKNNLVDTTYVKRTDIAIDIYAMLSRIELFSLSSNLKINVNTDSNDNRLYLHKINYNAVITDKQRDIIKDIFNTGIKYNQKSITVSEDYYKAHYKKFELLKSHGIYFKGDYNRNQILKYNKQLKEELDYIISRIEHKIFFGKMERLCLADIWSSNGGRKLLNNMISEMSKYLFIVQDKNLKSHQIQFDDKFAELLKKEIDSKLGFNVDTASGKVNTLF
ncbi:MAG: hypothetical protein KAQ94_09135 [Arcobacteraceae bacterium]|nr:hypothetical protein [Arcobacteraceae bacterium]